MTQHDPGLDPGIAPGIDRDRDVGGGTGDEGRARPLSSVGDLFADISRDLSTLMRQEVELAKAEMRESATKAGKGAGMYGGAGVAGHFVLLFVSIALWWGLGNSIGRGWSAVVVAVIWAVIAAILAAMARREIKQIKGMPQTAHTAREIPGALKGNEETP